MVINIVVNPNGASGKAWSLWEELEPVIKKKGCEYRVHRSTPHESIKGICSRISGTGEKSAVIVIGGDGSVNEAVNGISDFENTLFGFVPCGTGSDIGRDMDLPSGKKLLFADMLDCEVKRTSDVGELTFFEGGKKIIRRFNVSSDMGFGAATCEYVNRSGFKSILNRIGLGKLIYLIGAVKVCYSSEPATLYITDRKGTRCYKKCLCAIVMNHTCEGGGFAFCPDADFDDGLLDVCVGSGISKLAFLGVLPKAYTGKHTGSKGIYMDRTDRVIIRSDTLCWVHTDGEVIGRTNKVYMRILPEKLRLLL